MRLDFVVVATQSRFCARKASEQKQNCIIHAAISSVFSDFGVPPCGGLGTQAGQAHRLLLGLLVETSITVITLNFVSFHVSRGSLLSVAQYFNLSSTKNLAGACSDPCAQHMQTCA